MKKKLIVMFFVIAGGYLFFNKAVFSVDINNPCKLPYENLMDHKKIGSLCEDGVHNQVRCVSGYDFNFCCTRDIISCEMPNY